MGPSAARGFILARGPNHFLWAGWASCKGVSALSPSQEEIHPGCGLGKGRLRAGDLSRLRALWAWVLDGWYHCTSFQMGGGLRGGS